MPSEIVIANRNHTFFLTILSACQLIQCFVLLVDYSRSVSLSSPQPTIWRQQLPPAFPPTAAAASQQRKRPLATHTTLFTTSTTLLSAIPSPAPNSLSATQPWSPIHSQVPSTTRTSTWTRTRAPRWRRMTTTATATIRSRVLR